MREAKCRGEVLSEVLSAECEVRSASAHDVLRAVEGLRDAQS